MTDQRCANGDSFEQRCTICMRKIDDNEIADERFDIEFFGGARDGDDAMFVCVRCDLCRGKSAMCDGGEA